MQIEKIKLVGEAEKQVLGLKLPTDPRWVNMAEISVEDILSDHAYCEQKAATSGITLIQGYPDKHELVREVAPVVTEEWGHFRQVLAELDKRGLTLGQQRKDEYVIGLINFNHKGGDREDRLVDKLLTFALIEARSCERFRLLSLYANDLDLQKFYHKFMVSEAGHYRMFLDLAKLYGGQNPKWGIERVMQRWQEFLDFETVLMAQLEVRGDRMH